MGKVHTNGAEAATAAGDSSPPGLLHTLTSIPQINQQQWQRATPLIRWLITTRASVLPLTLFSAIFAGCLSLPASWPQWLLWIACTFGLTLAHATNNLLNDYVDYTTGLDRDNYFRTRYGAHPLAAGLLSKAEYRHLILITGLLSLALAGLLSYIGGAQIALFTLAGAILVLFYTYPLKRIALGELAVLAAWGPLMVGGVYLLLHGTLPASVMWAGLVYGLGPTVVIFGKHTDKREDDLRRGVRTLPNLLSARVAARTVGYLAVGQLVGALVVGLHYNLYGLLAIGLTLPSLWRLLRVTHAPPPTQKPADYPTGAWPLWYTTAAFVHGRWTGTALIVGLLISGLLIDRPA